MKYYVISIITKLTICILWLFILLLDESTTNSSKTVCDPAKLSFEWLMVKEQRVTSA